MIVTLTGPSGIGKGYIARELRNQFPSMDELVWFTTRPLRPGEDNGINRRSISRESFLAMDDRLVLVQELYGELYGLDLGEASYGHGLWVCELHVDNLRRAREIGLPIFSVALVPDDVAFLAVRLRSRGTEDEAEIAKRLSVSEGEIARITQSRVLFDAFFEVSAESEHLVVGNVVNALHRLQGDEATR